MYSSIINTTFFSTLWIATFEEALEIEQRYSRHRNSNSFREAQAQKQQRREHPVNENENLKSMLIDASSLVSKIDQAQGNLEWFIQLVEYCVWYLIYYNLDELEKKVVGSKVKNDPPKSSKYHNNCIEKNNTNLQSGCIFVNFRLYVVIIFKIILRFN